MTGATVSQEAMEKAKAMFPAKTTETTPSNGSSPKLDVSAYLEHYDRRIVKTVQHGTAALYCLERCVFDESHVNNEAAIGQDGQGVLFYQCFHNGCQGRTWKEARQIISGNDGLSPFMTGGETPNSRNSKGKTGPLDPMQYLRTGAQLQEMDVNISWLIEDLIPDASITTVIGPAGYGKSTVCLNIANVVDRGLSWLGRATIQRPVYILDFENPLAVDVDRARALDLAGVLFWHTTAEVPPPRIDSPGYEAYKRLPPGLVIVDGHRASQRGDENSSKDTGLVMERWKELRDLGFTIVLIHHTQKANAEVFRGSQALIDQADHVLYFYPVRQPGSDDPVDLEDPDAMTYFLGTKDKTRFKPCRLYLKRAGEGRFVLAGDPDDEKIELLKSLISDRGEITQKDLLKAAREEMNLGRPVVTRLLKQGETRGIWKMRKGEKNACLYQLVSLYPYIRGVQTYKQDSGSLHVDKKPEDGNGLKGVDTQELACLSDGQKQTGKQGVLNIEEDPRFIEAVEIYRKTEMSLENAKRKARELFRQMGW